MRIPEYLPASFRNGETSLIILVVWAALCSAWNLYGAIQVSNGGTGLGPTGSIYGSALALAFAVLFILSEPRWQIVYKVLAGFAAIVAAFTVWNAFTLDSSLWPSEFWRWAGIVLNTFGIVGAVIALLR